MGILDKVKEKAGDVANSVVEKGNDIIKERTDENIKKSGGIVTVNQETCEFKIKGSVRGRLSKGGAGKNLLKGTIALGTGGLSLLVPDKTKVGSDTWYKFDDLLSYDLIEDDEMVTSGGVGQAVIAGTLFGGVGAIAGGLTGKRKTKKKVENLIIKITLNDFENPNVIVPLIKKPVKIKSNDYAKAFEQAHEILAMLDIITHRR